uniref:SET domain-containing protein n=1 Tax=Corethron hystrix TaxID=216773 RepID=A0A7S1FT81_9STRA
MTRTSSSVARKSPSLFLMLLSCPLLMAAPLPFRRHATSAFVAEPPRFRLATPRRAPPLRATKKKKKGGRPAATGVRGFGGGPTKKSTEGSAGGGEVDRTRPARAFYDFVETACEPVSPAAAALAAANLRRVALGQFPLPDTDATLRGVVALRDLKKGEEILAVPYEMALDLGREGADPTLPAVALLQEICRGGKARSEHRPVERAGYLAMLPPFLGADCRGSTDFWSEAALDALQCPFVADETRSRRELVRLRHERDCAPLVPDRDGERIGDGSTLALPGPEDPVGAVFAEAEAAEHAAELHLRWATWLVTSRVLTVQGPAGSNSARRLMIPFVDMCNHDRSSPHVLSGRAEPGGMLKVIAGRDVVAGEQVNICYGGGVAGNDRFVQDYGFLDDFGTGGDRTRGYDIVARQVVGTGRVMEGGGAGGYMPPTEQEACIAALKETTVEEDQKILEETEQEDMRMAVRYRIGLKEALTREGVQL